MTAKRKRRLLRLGFDPLHDAPFRGPGSSNPSRGRTGGRRDPRRPGGHRALSVGRRAAPSVVLLELRPEPGLKGGALIGQHLLLVLNFDRPLFLGGVKQVLVYLVKDAQRDSGVEGVGDPARGSEWGLTWRGMPATLAIRMTMR